jgi:subtilase family serine protease
MHLKRKTVCVAGTGALVAAIGGLAGLAGLAGLSAHGAAAARAMAAAPLMAAPLAAVPVLAAPPVVAHAAAPAAGRPAPAVAAHAAQRAAVTVHPGIAHIGRRLEQPPTTADCETAYKVACYQPAQVEQGYNLWPLYNQGVSGQGSTIVVVDAFGSPTIRQDLSFFDKTFKLPGPPSFKIIQPAGAVHYDATNPDDLAWASETSLDVEYAHAIAPNASILLVETPVSETEGENGFPQIVQAEKYAIDHYNADVISQSFGATEETFTSRDSVEALRGAYRDAYLHNVTVLAASGDSGAADVGTDGTTYYLSPVTGWPASDPLVTGVGGTRLHLDAKGNHTSPDSVWNDTYSVPTNKFIYGDNGPNPLASGGGVSTLFHRPDYQDGVADVVGLWRGVPDISMSAACDGAVDVYMSSPGSLAGWYPTCGTSEATPLFAGIVALAAQWAHHSLGLINPALYRMWEYGMPGIVNVTTGNNNVSFYQGGKLHNVGGFHADGYSTGTGVGTVNAAQFVPELARFAGF